MTDTGSPPRRTTHPPSQSRTHTPPFGTPTSATPADGIAFDDDAAETVELRRSTSPTHRFSRPDHITDPDVTLDAPTRVYTPEDEVTREAITREFVPDEVTRDAITRELSFDGVMQESTKHEPPPFEVVRTSKRRPLPLEKAIEAATREPAPHEPVAELLTGPSRVGAAEPDIEQHTSGEVPISQRPTQVNLEPVAPTTLMGPGSPDPGVLEQLTPADPTQYGRIKLSDGGAKVDLERPAAQRLMDLGDVIATQGAKHRDRRKRAKVVGLAALALAAVLGIVALLRRPAKEAAHTAAPPSTTTATSVGAARMAEPPRQPAPRASEPREDAPTTPAQTVRPKEAGAKVSTKAATANSAPAKSTVKPRSPVSDLPKSRESGPAKKDMETDTQAVIKTLRF